MVRMADGPTLLAGKVDSERAHEREIEFRRKMDTLLPRCKLLMDNETA
jgi:hypothetical protein